MTLLAEPATGGIVDGARLTGERRVRADVVVVGSGAGGAPVAKALAEAGKRVVVVEEGAYFAREQLNARPRDMTALLYRDGGQVATVGTPAIMLPTGRAVGGTTLVNSGTCFRIPPRIATRWRDELGVEIDGLDALYAQVEREIGVRRVTPELAGANARIAKRGADALGWSGHYLDRNAVGCQGSGVCAFGCPTGAKQHAGEVYMNAAHAAGRHHLHQRARASGSTWTTTPRAASRRARAAAGRWSSRPARPSSPPARSTRRCCSRRPGSRTAGTSAATSASTRPPPPGR